MKVARWVACLAPLACLLMAMPAQAGGWNRGACQSRTYFGWPGVGGGEYQQQHNRNPWSPFTGKFFGCPFCCCTPEQKYEKFLRQYQVAQARYQASMNRLCWNYYYDYLNGGSNQDCGCGCNCNPYAGCCNKGCCGLKSKFSCFGKKKCGCASGCATECADTGDMGCQGGFCPVSEINQGDGYTAGYRGANNGYGGRPFSHQGERFPNMTAYQGHAPNAKEGYIACCRKLPIWDETQVCSCCKPDHGFHLKGKGLLGDKCEATTEDGLIPRVCNQVKACKACKGGSCNGFGCGHGAHPPAGAGPYNAAGMAGPGYMSPYPGMNREDALRYIEGFQYYPPYQIIRSPRDHFMFDAKYNIGNR